MADNEKIIQKVRAARVRTAAERGKDPRSHPDAEAVDEATMAELVEVARKSQPRYPGLTADQLRERRAARRRRIEHAADRGQKMPSFSIPASDLGELFTDAQLADLLRRRDEGEERAVERRQRREEQRQIRKEARAVERERQAKERAKDEKEAAKRLGL